MQQQNVAQDTILKIAEKPELLADHPIVEKLHSVLPGEVLDRKHRVYYIFLWIVAFLAFLGYLVYLVIKINDSYNNPAVRVIQENTTYAELPNFLFGYQDNPNTVIVNYSYVQTEGLTPLESAGYKELVQVSGLETLTVYFTVLSYTSPFAQPEFILFPVADQMADYAYISPNDYSRVTFESTVYVYLNGDESQTYSVTVETTPMAPDARGIGMEFAMESVGWRFEEYVAFDFEAFLGALSGGWGLITVFIAFLFPEDALPSLRLRKVPSLPCSRRARAEEPVRVEEPVRAEEHVTMWKAEQPVDLRESKK